MHSSRKVRLAQCKSTCEEHAASDSSFENINLWLVQLPSREANTVVQCKSSCKEQASSEKNLDIKPYIPWLAAALNTIYKANQSTNCPLKLEIVLKLAHQLGPLEQTTNSRTLIESPNLEPRAVNTRPWRHYSNMGSYLHPNMVKNANFRGLRRIWEFLPTLRGVIILPPSQPRSLAGFPRWQLYSPPYLYVRIFCCLIENSSIFNYMFAPRFKNSAARRRGKDEQP